MITRLCKQNGMEMEQAFRLSDFYIQKLDGIHTVEEVQSLHDEMVMDYTEKCADISETTLILNISTQVKNTFILISKNELQ